MNKKQEIENKLNEAIMELCTLPVEMGEKANDSVCEALILVKNIDYKPILETVPYQCCPVCSGSGQVVADGFTSGMYQTCKVCEGACIIPMHVLSTIQSE